MRNRRAFTLIELLVMIAIVGLLIAFLLPAVQSAREFRLARLGNKPVPPLSEIHLSFQGLTEPVAVRVVEPSGDGFCTARARMVRPQAVLGRPSVRRRGEDTSAWSTFPTRKGTGCL